MESTGSGPLRGVRVLDLSRFAPGQMSAMILADLGADVIRIDEPRVDPSGVPGGLDRSGPAYAPNRGKRSIVIDLKTDAGLEVFMRLAETSDALIEGFRPGVMDRLGIGPEAVRQRNPRLIYCSLSGYGQAGPYRDLPGHDLNYAAVSGVLSMFGAPGRPTPVVPALQIADYAGGSLQVALAIVAALLHRERGGGGQSIDASIADGATFLVTTQMARHAVDGTIPQPGADRLSGGQPGYDVYATADGGSIAVGAIEPNFWANLVVALGLDDLIDQQFVEGPARDEVRARLGATFATRTRDDWMAYLGDKNTCVSPVLRLDELGDNPHHRARGTITPLPGGGWQVGPSVRFSATPALAGGPPPRRGEHATVLLQELGFGADEIQDMRDQGYVG